MTAQDIRARIQHVKAAVDAARAANRPDVLRNEVAHLMLSSKGFPDLEAWSAMDGMRRLALSDVACCFAAPADTN